MKRISIRPANCSRPKFTICKSYVAYMSIYLFLYLIIFLYISIYLYIDLSIYLFSASYSVKIYYTQDMLMATPDFDGFSDLAVAETNQATCPPPLSL